MTRTTVLAYHAIGSCPRSEDRHNLFVTQEAFEAQMTFLARRRRVVPLEELVQDRVPTGKPAVAITFDEGYRNVLRNAGPVLRRFGFPATVFVPTDWRGRVNGWIEPSSCDLEIMDNEELVESMSIGIDVQSHGHAHIDMASATPEEVERDIKTSLDEIEICSGARPRFLAYPYGRITGWVPRAAERAGLAAAFTIDERHQGPYAFGRVQVTPLDGPRTFALKTSGWYLPLRKSRAVSALYGSVKPMVRRVLQKSRG